MAQGQQTTMKRIASELGVSVTTISKVLNNHGDISEATRDRVMAKIEELGYQRNAVARSLTLRRTHTIGIVIPDGCEAFPAPTVPSPDPRQSCTAAGRTRERWRLARFRRRNGRSWK